MSRIKLRPELLDMVRAGDKRATTRLGIKDNVTVGYCELYNPENPNDKISGFEVHKIEVVAYCDLSDEIARLEGYRSVSELREALISIYGNINDYDAVTVIHFDGLD